MIYVGVDPGVSGAVVVRGSLWQFTACRLSRRPREIHDWLIEQIQDRPVTAYLEHVWGQRGSSMQSVTTFMKNVGNCEAILDIAIGDYQLVRPQVWQQSLNCLTGGNKRVSRDLARRMFPDLKIYTWNADAFLIAEYGRQKDNPDDYHRPLTR